MLPDLHIGFSRGRSGGLVFPSLSEFSTVYCDPHRQRLWHSQYSRNRCFSGTLLLFPRSSGCWQFDLWFLCFFKNQLEHLEDHGSCILNSNSKNVNFVALTSFNLNFIMSWKEIIPLWLFYWWLLVLREKDKLLSSIWQ